MRSFSKKLAFALAAAMVLTTAAPAAQAKAADEMAMNKSSKILYVTDGEGINDAAQVGGGKGNVSSYDFSVKNKPENWKTDYTFTWASSDKSVATVKAGGLTTAVGVGKATISCVVTEKATDEVIATVKTEVTVKANAASVALLNPEVDGSVVEVGQTVDLNRVMYDADGNETTKRGTLVTDYTRWIAEFNGEAAEGVTITQKNGKFTFEEGAPAGDYTLYCETYQSSKYTDTTATSEKIVVTLADSTFEVDQKTVKSFNINFDAAVKSIGDLEVFKRVEAGGELYEYPMVVKSATLAEDGKSVKVELFSELQDKANYTVKLTGYDDYILTASVGAPATMTISASADTISPFVTAGVETPLVYRLYDAKGVDVTEKASGTVLFNVEEYSTDGSYYVAGNMIWFAKANLSVNVKAEYQSYENGESDNIPAALEFYSVEQAQVTLKGVSSPTLSKNGVDTKGTWLPLEDDATYTLSVKVALSEGQPKDITYNNQVIDGIGKINFETVTPEIAALSFTDTAIEVVAFRQGTATIVVNLETQDANGNPVTTPIGVVNITVKEKRALTNVTVSQALVTVGNAADFDTAEITLSAKDQYGDDVTISNVDFEGANAAANNVKIGGVQYSNGKIVLNGSVLAGALGDNKAVQLTYTAKVNNDKTVTFAVLVKDVSNRDPKTDYISIETSDNGNFGDVARTAASKGAKTATFSVFKMNNGVKVDGLDLVAYPSDTSTAKEGEYFFKVTKNGTDITQTLVAANAVSGNAVTINFSGTKDVAVSGSALKVVTYDMGAGNYVFTLYKAVKDGVVIQQQSATGVATYNPGAYSNAVRTSETAAGTSDKDIRDCFSVKDTQGNEVTTPYYTVDMNNDADDYVYVKSITFYESVDDAYVEYTVNVGVSLKK